MIITLIKWYNDENLEHTCAAEPWACLPHWSPSPPCQRRLGWRSHSWWFLPHRSGWRHRAHGRKSHQWSRAWRLSPPGLWCQPSHTGLKKAVKPSIINWIGINIKLQSTWQWDVHTQRTGAIDTCWFQLPLSTSILGSGDHFHGLCDFLDVFDGFQPNGN